jgi:hypothetical protein
MKILWSNKLSLKKMIKIIKIKKVNYKILQKIWQKYKFT